MKSECRSFQEQIVELENGETIKIFGYIDNRAKYIASWFGILATMGLLRLLFYWFPKLHIDFTSSTSDLRFSDKILVEDIYKGKWKSYQIQPIKTHTQNGLIYYIQNNIRKESSHLKSFTYKSITYVLEGSDFIKLLGLGDGIPLTDYTQGLQKSEEEAMMQIYGPNEINVPITSILELVLMEILTPFYVFQIFSFAVWLCELYWTFSVVIFGLTVFGIAGHVTQTRKSQKKLRERVKLKHFIDVYRKNQDYTEQILTSNLVPGDLISLKKGHVYCDALLISGTCLVDESSLSGESVPVLKTSIPKASIFKESESSGHVIYAGTTIIQNQSDTKLKAVVLRTGFLSTKGSLIRSIMYPPPIDYAFDKDSTKCCLILFGMGLLGAMYIVWEKLSRDIPLDDVIIKTLDTITILLPASLPVALTAGKLYALNHLRKMRITCTTNSKIINVAGSVDCICLDKTGTITNDHLDFLGAITKTDSFDDLSKNEELLEAMSVAHTLVLLDGTIQGDPLDVEMFKATKSTLENTHCVRIENRDVQILRHYHFVSDLQRMSVIVKDHREMKIFCKGSPEKLFDLCKIPPGTLEKLKGTLKRLSSEGNRILAIGGKTLEGFNDETILNMQRDAMEKEMEFLALLVFENKIKPDSQQVIMELKNAGMTVKMITGDNIETAISVARKCSLVDSPILQLTPESLRDNYYQLLNHRGDFAVTGTVWQNLQDTKIKTTKLDQILVRTSVFARITSCQKQQIIEQLQLLQYNVCMCGDGTNDCAALKTALVGLSLSETDASLAAPLTSHTKSLKSLLEVIREGRAALVTILGIFKIILAVNIAQYLSVMILYEIDASYSNNQFLYLDGHMILYSFFVGNVKACVGPLHNSPPTSSLLSLVTLTSLIGFVIPILALQLLAYNLTISQSWFVAYHHNISETNEFSSYENYAVFVTALFQYTAMAVVFSKGKPFREAIYTNWTLILCMLAVTTLDLTIALGNWIWILDVFELRVPPNFEFRLLLTLLSIVHFVTAFLIEEFLIGRYLVTKVLPKYRKLKTYEKVAQKSFQHGLFRKTNFDNYGFA